ncbi:uncharacterized protein LOC132554540 [Ylistrum balloti]|uniref:uncharacterized protein LOC132554540 n=1 Tax=Ylistrum balloti TaxID=509963 RepID=UPI002905A1B4|nr:uncharacterized protein LOC132554540 [Ylistrum balloti]
MYGTPLLTELLADTDIAVITEHWLLPEQMNFLNSIDANLKAYGVSDKRIPVEPENRICNRGYGGLAILWRNQLNVCPVLSDGSDRVLCCSVQLHNKSCVFVIGVLLPSTNVPLCEYRETLEYISDLYDKFSDQGHVIVVGDFNAQIGKRFGEKNRVNPNERGRLLESFIDEKSLISVNSQAWAKGGLSTFVSKDGHEFLIDHAMVKSTKVDCVSECIILDDNYLNASDHLPIILRYKVPALLSRRKRSAHAVNWNKCTAQQKANYALQVSEILSTYTDNVARISNVDLLQRTVNDVVFAVHEAARKTLPFKRYRPYLKPYWKNGQVKQLHKVMREKRLIWLGEGKPRGSQSQSYCEYKRCKRNFRNELSRAREEYEQRQFQELQAAAEMDSGTFYRTIRARKLNRHESSEIRINGEISRDPDINRNAWTSHYSKLAQVTSKPHFDNEHKRLIDNDINRLREESFFNDDIICRNEITATEVSIALKDMNNGKAGGHDYVVVEHIRFAGNCLLDLVTIIFNSILEIEDYPPSFKHGIVISLFKGGKKDRLDMNNYRDITLTPVLQKLFEKVMYKRIAKVSEHNNFPHGLQQGFRPLCGSITAAFIVREAALHYLEMHTNVYAAFLDNAKAFNSVWVNGLLYKLYHNGFNGKIWRILQNSFKDVTSCVLYEGIKGNAYEVKQGVGQGRTLSSWMFLVMINDLISNLDSTSLGLQIHGLHIPAVFLADDTLLLSSSVGNIQNLLDTVYEFSCKWRLAYNPAKSSLLRFYQGRKKSVPEIECKLGEQAIQWATEKEYAGIILTQSLQCNEDIKRSCAKGRQSLNALISAGIHDGGMNPLISCKLVESIVQPGILYGSELWGAPTNRSQEDLRLTQRYLARRCQGFEKRSPTLVTIRAIGLLDICGEVEKRKLMFWNKLCLASNTFVWKMLFIIRLCTFLFGRNNISPKSFIYDIFITASKLGISSSIFDYVFEGFCPLRSSWRQFCNRVDHDFYYSKWSQRIVMEPSLKTFCSIQDSCGPHPSWILGKEYPSFTWKLGELIKLSYRYMTEPVNCKLCKRHVDDIAVHFLIQCPAKD